MNQDEFGNMITCGNDQYTRNARPNTVPINLVSSFLGFDNNGLNIFLLHIKVNEHEILVSTNAIKLPQILSRQFRGICVISGFLKIAIAHHLDPLSKISIHLYLFLEKLIFTILKK